MYCEKQDIINDFKDLIVSNTALVTDAKLNAWIAEETSYINARISVKYVVPVVSSSAPDAFLILKRICIFRVSLRIKNVLEVRSDASQVNSEEKFNDNAVRRFEKDLEMIVSGMLPLPLVPTKDKRKGVSSFTNKASGTCSVFDVSKQQW